MHQLTVCGFPPIIPMNCSLTYAQAYGGLVKAPFAQIIPQSPGFFPIASNRQMEDSFNAYLSLLNVSTIEQARQLPYMSLAVANNLQIARASYGQFVYGELLVPQD